MTYTYETVVVTPNNAPPINFQGGMQGNNIRLSWNSGTFINEMRIFRKQGDGGYLQIATLNNISNAGEFIDDGNGYAGPILPATMYYYKAEVDFQEG